MFISDIDVSKRRMYLELFNCLIISVLLIIFNSVYTYYSFGEYSLHMRYMFLFPLVLGSGVSTVILFTRTYKKVSRVVFNMWNAGIATFVFGCKVQGIINISGRYTMYGLIYFILGIILTFCALVVFLVDILHNR